MALHFNETAPGVHTTTIVNPKTERRHNVAIIESCDAWQLFVDGELAVRDLPSFKAAVAAANKKIVAQRTPNMVRAACVLVLLSAVGASTIGMAKVLEPLFSEEEAVVAAASEAKGPAVVSGFTRVRPKPAFAKPIERPAKPEVVVAVEQAVVTVPKVVAPDQVAGKKLPAPAVINVAPDADNQSAIPTNALGLKPIVAAETKSPELAKTSTNVQPSAAVVPSTVAETPSEATPIARPAERDTAVVAVIPSQPEPEQAVQPFPIVSESGEGAEDTPPLPVRAPAVSAPIIRSAYTPMEPRRLNSILAELEVEGEAPVVTSLTRPVRATAKPKRRVLRRPAPSKKARHAHRAAPKRQTRSLRPVRRKPVHTAKVHREPPERTMTCFAHTCRFR